MAVNVAITLCLDVPADDSTVCDAVNEALRGLQRAFVPQSCVLDYAIGPWREVSVDVPAYEEGDAFTSGEALATMNGGTCDVVSGGVRVAKVAGIGDEQATANARLIAAAPELLAALEGLFEHCAMVHKHWGDACNRLEADAAERAARAAVAKVRGVPAHRRYT
jgi:hypothetical protein